MFYFKRNLPVWERIVRLCLAILVGGATSYFLDVRILQILGFSIAAILASTAFLGFCPACKMFGRKSISE
ncbi:YgaP family membrane protein [Acinetobacter bereziniae]|uniref:Inner membrane protein YgaP-like transmembrane domain-containing protein n=1 Tax=Acinetobacter bereziniae NIPH 3 TaxID=1217651 RepID=N8XA48_ACIBZ|nr:DUF2892 domain-containing protein [Acinetobacter bereziniae]ENV21121.1 hypothetical protein F963_02886 [Acinetobacter bereziniae NIPH 3]